MQKNTSTLIIACGALARELTWAIDANNWENIFEVTCLPANLHNRPEKIPEEMRKKIHQNRDKYKQIITDSLKQLVNKELITLLPKVCGS